MSTETVDPRFADIDLWPTERAVEAMLDGQVAAVEALRSQIAAMSAAAEAGADRLRRGGRLVYVGAGTSGRVAVQDGVELGPTYSWPDARLVYLMAGGPRALTEAVEGAEDDGEAGAAAIAGAGVGADDVVIGVAASGRTPFTLAAIEAGNEAGALTIGVSSNAGTPLLDAAQHGILAETGSELIAGSTRMKAGTAQKAVLNLLSTAMMLRIGRVYRGQMVTMRISNAKLLVRGRAMVRDLAGVDDTAASAALDAAGGDIRAAVLIAGGRSAGEAVRLLEANGGDLRAALGG
jgi:N-acetylmuramic acid 6-phosphate etherase